MKSTLWKLAGIVNLVLGLIGVVLPLLPTTPFLLLAAFCFQRGSPRLHRWLISHPRFGPPLRDWRLHGAIDRSAKRSALIAICIVFFISYLAGFDELVLGIQAAVLVLVATFIVSRPVPPSKPTSQQRSVGDQS